MKKKIIVAVTIGIATIGGVFIADMITNKVPKLASMSENKKRLIKAGISAFGISFMIMVLVRGRKA